MKTSDKPPPESYYDNYAVAYRIYKDAGIARDIARLVKPKEDTIERNSNAIQKKTSCD